MTTITIDTKAHEWVNKLDPTLHPLSLSIAGKTILEYLLQWAKYNQHETVVINDVHPTMTHEKIHEYSTLYDLKIIYKQIKKSDENGHSDGVGVGIFKDDGTYFTISSPKTLFDLEKEFIQNPVAYTSSIGYTNHQNIQIGKNVYIHRSVKLKAPLIIGDDCILEPNVKIENSVIGPNVHIGQDTVVTNSHIDGNLHVTENLLIKNKALFALRIYDKEQDESFVYDGVCHSRK